jgi:hypothetical protein
LKLASKALVFEAQSQEAEMFVGKLVEKKEYKSLIDWK